MMVFKADIHHPNDIINKYFVDIMPEKLKNYFGLPGEFTSNFPTKIFKRDGSEREMDWLMLVKIDGEEVLTLAEFQSYAVGEEKIKVIADCADYSKIYYGRPILTVIIITDGYESSIKEYQRTSSYILKPIYIRMTEEELTKRLNNLENKILNHKKLTDDEALDIVFLPMFAPKNKAKFVTKKITRLFHKDNSLTGVFRCDIAFGLSIMIRKYFDLTDEGKELLNLIGPELDKSRLRDVIDFEVEYIKKSYQKELDEKNEALLRKDEEIYRLKSKLKAMVWNYKYFHVKCFFKYLRVIFSTKPLSNQLYP